MDEIQTLIRELEQEQASLRRLIDESVKSGEYLIAHFHSEAKERVNRKLQTLRNLDDTAYDSKSMKKFLIKRAKAQLGLDYPDKLKSYLKDQIDKLEKELHDLDLKGKHSVSNSSILNGYLQSLIEHEIKGVRIVLRKSSDFYLDISKGRPGIKVIIPKIKSLRKSHIIHEDNLQHFFGLGFTLDNDESRLILLMTNLEKGRMLDKLKITISKIVFEVFYFREFEGESFIEIRE